MGPDTVYTIVVETTGRPVQCTTANTRNKTYSIPSGFVSHKAE